MSLVEYLYLNEKRLDSYIEQFRSPITFDKFAEWKAGLSLAGPAGEGTQTGHPRPLSRHEKVESVTEYLVQQELICGRPQGRMNAAKFVDDTFVARRFFIPEHNIALWISRPEKIIDRGQREQQATYLIEEYREAASESSFAHQYSGYSTLYLLSAELERNDKVSLRNLWQEPEQGKLAFSRDPMMFLEKVGAKVGPEQKVRTIYMFRASSTDLDGPEGHVFGVIGYPLWIERV